MDKNVHRIFEDPIDKEIYRAYSNTPVIETGTEWASLNSKLEKHSKKSNVRKTAITILLLLGVGAIWSYFVQKNNTNSKTIIKESIAKNTDITNPQNNLTEKGNSSITPQSNTNNVEQNIIATNELVQKNYNRTNIATEQKNGNTIIKNDKKGKINLIPLTPSLVNNQKQIEPDRMTVANNDEEPNQEETQALDKNSLGNEEKNTVQQLNEEKEQNIAASTTIIENNDITNTTLNKIDLSKNAIIGPALPIVEKKKRNREKAILNIDNDRAWNIEAFSGVNNSIKMQNNFAAFLAPNGYNDLRLNNEQFLQSLSAGVNVSYTLKNISFSTGINLLQIGDNVNYKPIQGNTIVANANGRTQFTYTELPLLIGTEWVKNRFGLGIKGGFSTGFLTQLSGQYASHNNFNTAIYDVKENKNTYRSLLFNIALSPHVNYYLNENSNLFFAPTYQRNLQSITKVDADVKQRYNIFGFRIGIKSRLN